MLSFFYRDDFETARTYAEATLNNPGSTDQERSVAFLFDLAARFETGDADACDRISTATTDTLASDAHREVLQKLKQKCQQPASTDASE